MSRALVVGVAVLAVTLLSSAAFAQTARQSVLLDLIVIPAIPTDNGSQNLLAATYSLDERQAITGQVIDISRRAHWAFVHINVTNADGDTERWVVEWARVPVLRGLGWVSDLRPRDRIVAIGSPSRNRDVHRLLLRKISRSDGSSWEGNPLGLDVLVPGGLLPNSRQGSPTLRRFDLLPRLASAGQSLLLAYAHPDHLA